MMTPLVFTNVMWSDAFLDILTYWASCDQITRKCIFKLVKKREMRGRNVCVSVIECEIEKRE